MKSLFELYQQHQGKVSDKWSLYLAEYDRLFSPYREQTVRLLEIGIQNGGSLEIWSRYFPHAEKLVGCDINPDCAKLTYADPRIAVVVADANTDRAEAVILGHAPEFDLIIDDGSHTSSDIVKSFARYFRHLKHGGLFVAEDLHCSYWREFEGGLYDPYSSIAFFKRLADVVNHEHWGVQKERIKLLAGFTAEFGTVFDEEQLSTIHSIEFINSMCVVRKAKAESNVLGLRIAAGGKAEIVPCISEKHGEAAISLDQNGNVWTLLERSPDEMWKAQVNALATAEKRAADAEKRAAECEQKITELHGSTSWRLTQPLRSLGFHARRLKSLVCKMITLSQQYGPLAAARKAIKIIQREGASGIVRRLTSYVSNDYVEWILHHDTLDDETRVIIKTRIAAMGQAPLVSIVMPTYNANLQWIKEAIDSVRNQIYPHWELCIADDASTDPTIRPLLEHYAQIDNRIKVVFRKQNGHISAASNSALELVTGEWVALLDHDDLLAEHALYWIADAIQNNPQARLIYSDEDKLDGKGQRCLPFFKPDWSPHLACSQAYLGHLVCLKISDDKLQFDPQLNGSQDYDLWLRTAVHLKAHEIVHIPRILYHWRMHAGSTASNASTKPYADDAGLRAVERYIKERYPREAITVKSGTNLFTYRLEFSLPSDTFVSIIIPTKDKVELLSECVESIVKKSTWKNFEILILDNRSTEAETFRFFSKVTSVDSRIKVIKADFEFNWSRLNNFGASHARGNAFVFLNNDTKIISPDWLESLVGYARLPDVGVVGGLLHFEDNSIQHAGVVVGMGGWADHVFRTQDAVHSGVGPFVSPALTRNVLAVTGACMAISRDKFDKLNGFDESFIICGSDVEICIKAWKSGLYNVISTEAKLYHYESKTRSSHVPEEDFIQSDLKYAPYRVEKTDPFYNKNLSLLKTDPRINLDRRNA